MKIKILFIGLLMSLTSNTIFSQSVVVNKYQNVGTAADIIELLVVQDNTNLQGVILKSFSSNNTADGGGSLTFKNDPLWASLRAGTLIVIRLTLNTAADVSVSCTDFNIDVGGSNTTYFTVGSGSFDLAQTDMCMIKTGTTTGVANNIHTLRTGTTTAQWTSVAAPKLGTTTLITSGNFVVVDNASSVIGDYALGTTGATVGTGYTFGSGNNANNTAFINFLRGPVSSAATTITDTSFFANWAAVTGAVSYELDVATDSGFTSFVSGFNALNVGNVITYNVTGLASGVYYYRVRAVNATPTTSGNSCTQTVSLAKVTQANGDWNTGATWVGGVAPLATDNVFIKHNVYLNGTSSTTTRNAGTLTTVDVGASLATANAGLSNNNTYANNGTTIINGTFRIEDLATAANVGIITGNNFVYGPAGTLQFNNLLPLGRLVNNTDVYWPVTNGPYNVTVSKGGISMQAGAARTVNGALVTPATTALTTCGVKTIAASSDITIAGTATVYATNSFQTASPIYTATSTLIYNITAPATNYNRNLEWNAVGIGTIGVTPGYPNNVTITGSTQIRYNPTAGVQRAIKGNLTIDPGSNLRLDIGTANADLTIGGSVTNDGTFTFPTAAAAVASVVVLGNYNNNGTTTLSATPTAGYLKIGGNFSNGIAGVFTNPNKAVYFTGTSPTVQVVSNANTLLTPLVFPYVVTTGAATIVQLANDLGISSPSAVVNGGVALTLANSSVFDLNGKTLTIGTATVGNTISGSGSFKGSTASNLSLLGTGSIGNLKFAGDLNLATFTMDRTASSVGCVMTSALTINTNLVLTNGHIDLGSTTMTLANGVNPTGLNGSHVIADVSAGGILNKVVSALGTNYVFPIGSGASEYSPPTVNFSAGSFSSATLGMAVENPATGHPNWSSSASYLKRYWSITSSGITTPTYDFSATYPAADVVGTIGAYYKSNQWDGSDWTNGGIAITSGTISKTGCTINSGTNHISAAIRDQEIEVKSGVAGVTILNGSISTNGNAAFGTKTVASNTANTFSIYNKGGISLSLTNTPIVEILAGSANYTDFVVTTQPVASTVNAESSLTFVITFTPSTSGYRWATVRIQNNDGDENPYTFVIDGTGQCVVASTNTITPDSGPIGTEVTITAVTNNLFSATASLNGLAATISSYSPAMATATVIKAIIPAGAVSGQLTTTNSTGCKAMNYFTVIDNEITSCQGTGTARNKIFISEVTDHGSGSHSFIELWNATGASVNISGYTIRVYYNGGSTFSTITIPAATNLANNTAYVIGFGGANAADVHGTFPATQTSGIPGINSNDNIRLYDASVTQIDQWGDNTSSAIFTISSKDYTYRRKNTGITAPSTTWNPNDWTAFTPVDYTDIGKYNYSAGVLPTVSALSYTPTCKAATLTVTVGEGLVGSNPLVISWYAVANGSNTWNLITDSAGVFSGATTNSLYIYNISSYLNYQFYCQVWENTATCYISSNAVKITAGPSATWLATNLWSTGIAPDLNTAVIIDHTYDTTNAFSPSFDACSVTINSGKTVTIRANDYVNIQNDLTVTGTLDVENNGSLVMIDDNGVVTNTGTTTVKRTAANIRGYDYVYWSSPVIGQSLGAIYSSPTPGYMFYWDPVGANINSPISTGNWIAAAGAMTSGKGYIVRGSSSYGMAASSIPSVFTGAVNSGIVPVPIGRGNNTAASTVGSGNGVTITNFDDNWNLVGNPYPSAINAKDFLTYNTNLQGFIYLWKHNNIPVSLPNPFYGSFLYDYNPSDYLAYNKLGAQTQNGFDGYIASGQGFFILMNDGLYDTSQTATFKNSMRSKTYANTQFYKNASATTASTTEEERHRIWLDLVDSNNLSVRTLVGYAPEATAGLDRLYDAFKNTANDMSIHSLAENKTLIIQGRGLPFDQNDQVPIGVTIKLAGTYKIAIAAVDGLFSDAAQGIYLEDKQLDVIYDLRQSPYTFDATVGMFNDRFVLRYTGNALSNPDIETPSNSVTVLTNHGQMTIKSSIEAIQDVTVYDILGRQLFDAKSIGNKDFAASNISMSQQTLIVKIKLENGIIVTKKIIL